MQTLMDKQTGPQHTHKMTNTFPQMSGERN
jgi:hypothetical protein